MPTYTYTVTGLGAGPASAVPVPLDQIDKLFGRDILWHDGNSSVSPAGDWTLVEGNAAIRQWVVNCLVTSPGEFATRPQYGVGARDYLRGRQTQAAVDELKGRIQSQLVRDDRIAEIDDVAVEFVSGSVIKIAVSIIPKGRARRAQPFIVATEIT